MGAFCDVKHNLFIKREKENVIMENTNNIFNSTDTNNITRIPSEEARVPLSSYMPYSNEAKSQDVHMPTSIADLTKYTSGTVVELPEFGPGQPFYARLRRPSMLALVRSGKIPNSLLNAANEMFQNGMSGFDADDNNAMNDLFSVLDVICEASFVEPSYQQLKEANVTLTDEQYMFVFAYSQQGVKALESFR